MSINSDKKDLILGGLGVLFVVGALVFIGVGVQKSFNEEQGSYSRRGQGSKETPSRQKKSVPSESSKQEEPESEMPSEPSEESLTITKVSLEPAEAPDSEDIDYIVIEDSQCSPPQAKKRGRSGIVLEVSAQDQDYLFTVEEISLEENFQQGQTKTITFPAFLVSSDTISFQCQPIN